MIKVENNEIHYTNDDKTEEIAVSSRGLEIVNNHSYAALEEDLSSLSHNEINVPMESVKASVDKGVDAVLNRYGRFLNPEVLDRLGLSDSHESVIKQGTTLEIGKVKMVVLNQENFSFLNEAYEGTATRGKAFGSAVDKERRSYVFGKELVTAHEHTEGDTFMIIVRSPDNADAKSMRPLESITRHEFMHTIGVGNLFPQNITEGAIHYCQSEITGKPATGLVPERQHATQFVTKLGQHLETLGMSHDDYDSILVGNNKETFDKAFETFSSAYGRGAAEKVFAGKFKNAAEADAFIENLKR